MRRSPLSTNDLNGLLPTRQQAGRRVAGLALLGASVWLVAVVALVQSVIGLFR
jgi:hypothetical protein